MAAVNARSKRQTAALEAVARARETRKTALKDAGQAETKFRAALVQAKARGHSWGELSAASGLSRAGVRWLVDETQRTQDAARRAARKEKR